MKCPRCHEGDLFETKTFSFKKPFDMYKECPVCHQNYLPEPGFYYGAMFISYIIMGFFCLAFVLVTYLVLDMEVKYVYISLISVIVVFFVWIFRFARSLWITINVKYDPNAVKK